ncbi:MAG: glycosyltransferase [Oligoflexia bacterium]|nr:glycosyltransferase [Oligoflexia bacterium]
MPSYEECFSLALLDAQLAALPVVGTNSGGTPELVRPGETGWLCEPKSLESLKEAIKSALREKDKWPAMGEKAKERVKKEYDQQEIFNNILKEYAN